MKRVSVNHSTDLIVPMLFSKSPSCLKFSSVNSSHVGCFQLFRSSVMSEGIFNCYKFRVVEGEDKECKCQLLDAKHFIINMIACTTKNFLDPHVNSPETNILLVSLHFEFSNDE